MSMLELDRAADVGASVVTTSAGGNLSRREIVVLRLLSDDVTITEIAAGLFVTKNTVKSQVRSVYRKLGVNTRGEAIAWAESVGLR